MGMFDRSGGAIRVTAWPCYGSLGAGPEQLRLGGSVSCFEFDWLGHPLDFLYIWN